MPPFHMKVLDKDFKYKYIPDYAQFLLDKKLEEFVTVGIRYCREAELPMMKPLEKISEEELVKMSIESNRELLEALASNKVASLIEKRLEIFLNNQMVNLQGHKVIDRSEIITDDFVLGSRVKRKMFNFFLQSYTQNAVIHTLIMDELDSYTTKELLITFHAIIDYRKQIEGNTPSA